MNRNRSNFIAPPWWKTKTDDYTKGRSGVIGYTMDDLIGRKDINKYKLVTSNPTDVTTTSGTVII